MLSKDGLFIVSDRSLFEGLLGLGLLLDPLDSAVAEPCELSRTLLKDGNGRSLVCEEAFGETRFEESDIGNALEVVLPKKPSGELGIMHQRLCCAKIAFSRS